MTAVGLFNACDAVVVRYLSSDLHPFVIAFFRSLFGLIVVVPWICTRVDLRASPYRLLHVLRAALKLVSLVLFFAAFASAQLPDVTAIIFTSPIFLMLGAWLFLNERMTPRRGIAIALGFLGMLFVVRPGDGGISLPLLFALGGAILTAIIQLMLKSMSGRDSTDRLVAWNLIAAVPLAVIPAILYWTAPTPVQLLLLMLQGALGALNMTLVTYAMSLADASFVAPLDFLRLPFVAVLAYFAFGQVATAGTWIGAGVILVAVYLIVRTRPLRAAPLAGSDI